jgi:hypothetical protein
VKCFIFALVLLGVFGTTARAQDTVPDLEGTRSGKGKAIAFGNIWGMQTLSGNGETTQEPMIGELTGANNRTVVLVDTDGYLNGELVDDNTLNFCYTQAGGKTQSSVVSCTEVKRTP